MAEPTKDTAPKAKEKAVEYFYANKKEGANGPFVQLWKVGTTTKGAPAVEGKIGNRRVSGFVRKGPKAPFVSFVNPKKGEDGKNEQLFTGNVVVNDRGAIKLAIKPAGGKDVVAWASVSPKVPNELLDTMGLDRDILATKRAEAAKAAAESKAAKAAPKA